MYSVYLNMITVLICQPYILETSSLQWKVIIAQLHIRVVKMSVDIASSIQYQYYTIQDIHWGKLKTPI